MGHICTSVCLRFTVCVCVCVCGHEKVDNPRRVGRVVFVRLAAGIACAEHHAGELKVIQGS